MIVYALAQFSKRGLGHGGSLANSICSDSPLFPAFGEMGEVVWVNALRMNSEFRRADNATTRDHACPLRLRFA